jgi:hypothetical protein
MRWSTIVILSVGLRRNVSALPLRAAAKAKRAEAERKAVADAKKIVAIWNARQAGGRALWFYPTIGAAIAAVPPWMVVIRATSCGGLWNTGPADRGAFIFFL